MMPVATSDMRSTFCPFGLTNSTSMSLVQVCLKPLSCTVTVLIGPLIPETVIGEG